MNNRKERNGKGRTLTLFWVNGQPDGIVKAGLSDWTGQVLTIPHRQLTEGLSREETSYHGVYLLRGQGGEGYIGEAVNVKKRIKRRPDSKAKAKTWWSNVAIITTKDSSLHTTLVKYLEARLIEIVKQVDRVNLKNRNTPVLQPLPEEEQTLMENFLKNILLVLPYVGFGWFSTDTCPNSPTPATKVSDGGGGRNGGRGENRTVESQTFVLQMPKHNIRATARIEGKKFVVQKGSKARPKWGKARHPTYPGLFERLCKKGNLKLTEDGLHRVFTKDCIFDNSSAAGSVVTGSSCNGPKTWKTADGSKTYAEWKKTAA